MSSCYLAGRRALSQQSAAVFLPPATEPEAAATASRRPHAAPPREPESRPGSASPRSSPYLLRLNKAGGGGQRGQPSMVSEGLNIYTNFENVTVRKMLIESSEADRFPKCQKKKKKRERKERSLLPGSLIQTV